MGSLQAPGHNQRKICLHDGYKDGFSTREVTERNSKSLKGGKFSVWLVVSTYQAPTTAEADAMETADKPNGCRQLSQMTMLLK